VPATPPIPANVPLPSVTPSSTIPSANSVTAEPASTFAANNKTNAVAESEWSPVDVAVTSQTAFQNLETKTAAVSYQDGSGTVKTTSGSPQSPITSSSQIVTEIKKEN
jgi:hypothetical protein